MVLAFAPLTRRCEGTELGLQRIQPGFFYRVAGVSPAILSKSIVSFSLGIRYFLRLNSPDF